MTDLINPIHLRARITDPIHFVFIAETWEAALKPFQKAKWKHEKDYAYGAHSYDLKSGHFLTFPQFNMTAGGFYAAHLYMVCRELDGQIKATLTTEGLTLEAVETRTTMHLKPRGLSGNDEAHHAILGLEES